MNLFGRSKFYRKNLKWTDEFVRKNINIIEHNYSSNPYKNKWNCNVHSVHDYETKNVYMIDYKDSSMSIMFYFNKFLIIIVMWIFLYFSKFIIKKINDLNEK